MTEGSTCRHAICRAVLPSLSVSFTELPNLIKFFIARRLPNAAAVSRGVLPETIQRGAVHLESTGGGLPVTQRMGIERWAVSNQWLLMAAFLRYWEHFLPDHLSPANELRHWTVRIRSLLLMMLQTKSSTCAWSNLESPTW